MPGSKSQGTEAARWEPCADRETVREPCGGWPGPSGLPRRRVLCLPGFCLEGGVLIIVTTELGRQAH